MKFAATLLIVLASLGVRASEATRHERLPLQIDFDRCVLKIADSGNQNIQGRLRLQLLIRPAGNVYAAFVHSEKGVDDRRLERCLTDTALLWKLPPVALDYSRAYDLSFVPGGTDIDMSELHYFHGDHFAVAGRASVFMPDINDPPAPAELDVRAAQATLAVAEWATEAETGIAQLEVRRYPEAVLAFRQALQADATDAVALRGLAVALAESGTGLREARLLGEHLVALHPESEASHEALLRACLAAGDDPCAYGAWNEARQARDLAPRSRQLSELQPLVEKAAARLNALARSSDACVGVKSERDRALCVVRRCLDGGTAAFAEELSAEKGADYLPQEWRAEKTGEGRMVVTRPLTDGAARREPRWLVKIGDSMVTMAPTNDDAKHITLHHSACVLTRTLPMGAKDLARGPTIEEPIDKLVEKK